MLAGVILNYEEGVVLDGSIYQEVTVEHVRVGKGSRGEGGQEERRSVAGHLGGSHILKVEEDKEFRMHPGEDREGSSYDTTEWLCRDSRALSNSL